MPMKIYVRRRHIREGSRKDARFCPVALALGVTGDCFNVGCTWLDNGHEVFKTPRSVRSFIARFDAGKPVKPFAFVLK